ncbi:hypothetical protein HER10_EVM0012618 [Colletotrichum scovillei]|uniref:CAAX prenyl protease 1 n=1 Tax=Colletotrichum scovillei TaxID=1209932 RepID=A0A9P7U5H1_9PEZI|nr:uncharacterized protein HER10_EVM0012618 [Colletotrichum scovillei]KAF4786021.1 hypothetical protein HER10_EVM0012618 [Colletotrichum scovillei]KAG7038110.1 CAAX prenyl protease 1 [Colletotrichum scovillei]KAG7040450.1 CAAX prenyl protease 1 [Colletotrichum scovillei]KAG7060498.1 CAAX prenyl protease 1 [Colletotrichum scovillei]
MLPPGSPGRKILGFLFGINDRIYNLMWSHDKGIPTEHVDHTLVTIMLGDESGAGGHQPQMELYDDFGAMIGHRMTNDGDRIGKNNNLDDSIYKIEHNVHVDKMTTPKYIVINQWSSDAICVSAIQVSNGKLSSVFYGDLGALCGQSWFFSRRRLDAKLMHPKCVWLDEDHTNGFNARAMSFHLNDMLGTPDKVKMYKENPQEYLCKSTPRFSFWYQLRPGANLPFFKPPLEYERDAITGQEGRDKDPQRAVDKVKWDKMTDHDPQPIARRSMTASERRAKRKKLAKRQGRNPDITHLIITRAEEHAASLVCNSTTSYGHDVVSLHEKTYCDMTVKRLYNLCDNTFKEDCFDVERRTLIGHGGIGARGEISAVGNPQKRYETAAHWEE